MKNEAAVVKAGQDWHGMCGVCGAAIFGRDYSFVRVSERNGFGAHVACAITPAEWEEMRRDREMAIAVANDPRGLPVTRG